MRNKDTSFFLPLIIAIALSLRLVGITHGFPFIFHPDEPTVIRTALSMRFFPNPGHFDWPHLFIYINYFCYLFFAQLRNLIELLNFKSAVSQLLPIVWDDKLVFYFITRVLSAVLGALTVIPVYLTAKDAFGKRVGIIAAITMAVLPFHVWHSHYALIDAPMLFFAAWGVFFMTWILKRKDINDYSGAGFYLGLATSTKYNAMLNALALPLAHVIRVIYNKEKLLDKKSFIYLLLSFVTFTIGFVMGTPYAVLDYQTFLRTDGPKGAMWQFTNVGSVDFNERLPEFVNKMVYKVSDDVGYTVLAGFFLTIFILLIRIAQKKNRPEDQMLLFLSATGLFLLLYVSGVKNSRSHYYFIAYPYLIICFAYVLNLLMQQLSLNNAIIGFFIFMLGIGLPSLMAVRGTFTFSRSDTRAVLYHWLKINANKEAVIYYNKSNLTEMIESLPNKRVRLTGREMPSQSGYLIVSEDSEGAQLGFLPENNGYKYVATVENSFRLGPKIQIYSIAK